MARLPETRRILREDVKDAPDWIVNLLTPINLFFEAVYNALSKNLTFGENFASQIKEMSFQTLPTYSGGDFTEIKFSSTLKSKASGLLKLRLWKKDVSYSPITSAVDIDWIDENGQITIGYITGLSNSTSYTMRVLVI